MPTRKVKRKILSDHRRKGKRFIPPFSQHLGPLREVSWVNTTLPELIWIACLHHVLGIAKGTALAVALSKASLGHCPDHEGFFAATSHFYALSKSGQLAVAHQMRTDGHLNDLRVALGSLSHLYPESPFSFLFSEETHKITKSRAVKVMKLMLGPLFDKRTWEATMLQGTGVYLGFVQERFVVTRDSALSKFPELESYPETEQSKLIASAVRATIPLAITVNEQTTSSWPRYFWNRGLEIDDCEVSV